MTDNEFTPGPPRPPLHHSTRIAGAIVGIFAIAGLGYVLGEIKRNQPASASAYSIAAIPTRHGQVEAVAAVPTTQPATVSAAVAVAPTTKPALALVATIANDEPIALAPDRIFQAASPSVFTIEVAGEEAGRGKLGSGFIVSADGLMVTNFHVIRDAVKATVKSTDGGRQFNVLGVVATDRARDLALLQTDATGLTPLSIAANETPAIGSRVYAIGSPQGFSNTLSEGLISGVRHDFFLIPNNPLVPMLQTTVPISPGSSGGPLLSTSGKVVGATSETWLAGQNLNFAVPASSINRLINNRGKLQPLSEAAATTPTESRLVLDDAWVAMLARNYPAGEAMLASVAGHEKSDSWYWFLSGYLHEHTFRGPIAVDDYAESIRFKTPYAATVYYRLGCTQISLGHPEEAIDAFRAAVNINPGNIPAWQAAAAAFTQTGQPLRAIDVISKAIKIRPDNAQSYYILGSICLGTREYGRAAEALGTCTKLLPNDAVAWVQLARAHTLEKDAVNAKQDWEMALKYDPNGPMGALARTSLRYLQSHQ